MVNEPKDLNANRREVYANESKGNPGLTYDTENLEWTISGKSYPADSKSFYRPLIDWVESLQSNPPARCGIQFKLEFFNTVSSHIYVHVLTSLKKLKEEQGVAVGIRWFWEKGDDDMNDSAFSLMHATGIDLDLVEVDSIVEC